MDSPAFVPRTSLHGLREPRDLALSCEGLWCWGALDGLRRPSVAVVGTRAATPYGRRMAAQISADLARAGCCIVSGLALGIDASAHEAAVAVGGSTIGILGSGHGRFFPRANRPLAQRMVAAGGAVLSPFAPHEPAYPSRFLERNAVVAALSDAVVVVEAPARSGALNTAGWAAGRIAVFAVPGDVDRPHSAGCLALIRDGAILARGANDVLEVLGVAPGALLAPLPAKPMDPLARSILRALERGELGLDELVVRSRAPTSAVLAALAMLEIDGLVEPRGPLRYARR